MFCGRLCDWRIRSIRAAGCVCAVATGVAGDAKEAPLTRNDSMWEPSLVAKLAGGYKDNVALSQANPEASAFVRTAVDAVAVRLPIDGTQLTFLLMGEDTRYFSSDTVEHEDFLFGQAEVRRFWLNDWQGAVSFEGAYIDQVVDLSVTETNQSRLVVKGGTIVGRPSLRRELSPNWWLGLESPFTRQMFDGLPDDYWVGAPKVTVGQTYGNASEVSFGYEYAYRHYDTDPARAADQTPLTNTTRISYNHEIQGAWKHHWDERRRFRSLTRVSYRVSLDNASGYFDYERFQIAEQFRFRAGPWELSVEGRLAHYRFPIQKGTNEKDDRERGDIGVTVHLEYALGRRTHLFADYDLAQTVSNLEVEEYTAHTVWGGVSVEF